MKENSIFPAHPTPKDFQLFDYSKIGFIGDESDILRAESILSDSAWEPVSTEDGRTTELLDPPTRVSGRIAATILGVIKKRVDSEEAPPEIFFGKGHTRFAIRVPDGAPDRVILEFPRMNTGRNEMLTYILQTPRHEWWRGDRWNIPAELPVSVFAIQVIYSFTGTPFESPAFEQYAADARYRGPGPCYGAYRAPESTRHFLDIAKKAWVSEGVNFLQLEDEFYFYNEQNNDPPLTPDEMAVIAGAVLEEICNGE
jgi:hypothetical protein